MIHIETRRFVYFVSVQWYSIVMITNIKFTVLNTSWLENDNAGGKQAPNHVTLH